MVGVLLRVHGWEYGTLVAGKAGVGSSSQTQGRPRPPVPPACPYLVVLDWLACARSLSATGWVGRLLPAAQSFVLAGSCKYW